MIPDNNPNANPRGMAVRFHLAERVHTDIVSHSTDGFPTRTGQEFLEMLRAARSSDPAKGPDSDREVLGAHPAALAFVQTPKPTPQSFATEQYFGVTAMQFSQRQRGEPLWALSHCAGSGRGASERSGSGANAERTFCFRKSARECGQGPVRFRVMAQLANEGDTVDDATVHWPEDRTVWSWGRLR